MHVELRIGEFVVGMAGIEAARAMHGIDVAGDRPRAEVVLWTDDVDAAFETVVAAGARPLAEPHDFLGSVRAAWVADPEGNPVELVMRRNGRTGAQRIDRADPRSQDLRRSAKGGRVLGWIGGSCRGGSPVPASGCARSRSTG